MSRLSRAQESLFESCVAASANMIVVESEGAGVMPGGCGRIRREELGLHCKSATR
jgi:hypothetical protein